MIFLSLVTCRTWHFDGLKSIYQDFSQSSSLPSSSCNMLASDMNLWEDTCIGCIVCEESDFNLTCSLRSFICHKENGSEN